MLGCLLLIMISSLFNPVQAIEVKMDFNSFYEEEQYPYSKLLNLLENSNIPFSKKLPIWLSQNKSKGTSLPQDPGLWIKEKLGIPNFEKLNKQNKPHATEFFQKDHDDYLERKFFIEDSILGKFEVSILDSGNLSDQTPVLLALHGHGGAAGDFMDTDFIEELAREGTIVVLPNFRAMRNLKEVEISQKLFSYGLSLMGVRILECLNILNLVENLYPGDRKIGLIGHSGGSAIARILAWIVPSVNSCAIDYDSSFRCAWNKFCCEALPALHNEGSWISNPDVFPVPLRKFPYNFVPENDAVLDFFMNALKPPGSSMTVFDQETLPAKLQMQFDDLIRKPSNLPTKFTSSLLNYLKVLKTPLKQDGLILKALKYSFLLPLVEQPTFLFNQLNTPASKLNFFSHLSAISESENLALEELKPEVLDLIKKYPERSQRNIIIAHAFYNLARGNPKIALRLLSQLNSMVNEMGIAGTRIMWKAGLITFYADSDPSKSLRFWPVSPEEKIILGSEWTCRTMDKNLKTRISKFMLELLKQIDIKQTLVPYSILENLLKSKLTSSPKPIVRKTHSGESFLLAMLRIGKIHVSRDRVEDAANLAKWFFDPEEGCSYLSELVQNITRENDIKALIEALKDQIKMIQKPLFRVPFVITLLRYHGDRQMHAEFKKWFEVGIQYCLKTEGSFDRFEPKFTLMLETAAEYGYSDLVLETIGKIPDLYFLDHILNTLLDDVLILGNVSIAESIIARYKSFKSRERFLKRIAETRLKYESIGKELGKSFLEYASDFESPDDYDLDRIRRALDDYRGKIIQASFSDFLTKALVKIESRPIGRHELKVLINSLKASILIGSNNLGRKIESKLNSIVAGDFPEDWQHIILDWIEITRKRDTRSFDNLIKKLTEPEVKVQYFLDEFSRKNVSSDEFNTVLKSIRSLDDHENQASLLLDFAESQVNNSTVFSKILNELNLLEPELISEMRLEVYSKACSILMENGFTREAFNLILLIKSKLNSFGSDLSSEALVKIFSLARDLNNSALCFQIAKQLLQALQSEQISIEKLRIISEFIINLEEDPFPLESYLVDSLQRILVEKISAKNSPCYEILLEDSSLKSVSAFKVIEKCTKFLRD